MTLIRVLNKRQNIVFLKKVNYYKEKRKNQKILLKKNGTLPHSQKQNLKSYLPIKVLFLEITKKQHRTYQQF